MKKTYLKCDNCGAQINLNSEDNLCPYCGAIILVEDEKISAHTEDCSHNTTTNTQSNGQSYVEHAPQKPNYYAESIPSRPRINGLFFIILCCFYVFPGIIYYAVTKNAQRKWDNKYSRR